jgi:hypothetical protein
MSDTLEGELSAHDLRCAWCGSEINHFYVEPSDASIPEKGSVWECKDCGNETVVQNVVTTLTVVSDKARAREQLLLERQAKQAKFRDRVIEIRRSWNGIRRKFSLYCKVAGHTWTVCARGTDPDGRTSYDGVKNVMAYCQKCDARHDTLKGDIAWVTGCDD